MPEMQVAIFVMVVAIVVVTLTIRNILHAEKTKKRVQEMNDRLNGMHTPTRDELGHAGKPKL